MSHVISEHVLSGSNESHHRGMSGIWHQAGAIWSVLQCVAVCCSVLQCVAVCCSVLHCVAVCCSGIKLDAIALPSSMERRDESCHLRMSLVT